MDDEEYANAKARVEKELGEAVNAVWESLKEFRARKYSAIAGDLDASRVTLIDKAYCVTEESGFMPGSPERKRISMLLDLHRDTFWHCTDNWGDISPALSDENRAFYAKLMLEQAKRSAESDKISRLGYTWIVEQYDNGKLKAFIDDKLLAESVNRGFWEIVNGYFSSEGPGYTPPLKSFEVLRRYMHLLDLTRFKEFKKGEMYSHGAWLENTYVAAYVRAKASNKLSRADLGILAKPIIEQEIEYSCGDEYDWDDERLEPEKYLRRKLRSYSDVLGTPAIQKLLKYKVAHYVSIFELYYAETLLNLVRGSKQAKQNLVSKSLDRKEHDFEREMVHNEFPPEWLTDEAKGYVQDRIVKVIDEEYKMMPFRKFTEHIEFIKRGARSGLIHEDIAKEKIERALNFYVESKRRPGGEVAQAVNTMEFPDFVDTAVIEKARGMAAIDSGTSEKRSAEARERIANSRRESMERWELENSKPATKEEGKQLDFTNMLRGGPGKTKSKSI